MGFGSTPTYICFYRPLDGLSTIDIFPISRAPLPDPLQLGVICILHDFPFRQNRLWACIYSLMARIPGSCVCHDDLGFHHPARVELTSRLHSRGNNLSAYIPGRVHLSMLSILLICPTLSTLARPYVILSVPITQPSLGF